MLPLRTSRLSATRSSTWLSSSLPFRHRYMFCSGFSKTRGCDAIIRRGLLLQLLERGCRTGSLPWEAWVRFSPSPYHLAEALTRQSPSPPLCSHPYCLPALLHLPSSIAG